MDTWDQIVELRTELAARAADFGLAEWNTPTLCQGWRVRDVVAHLTLPERFSMVRAAGGILRAGFSIDRFLRRDAITRGSVPVPDVLTAFTAAISHRSTPPGRQARDVLVDLTVHLHDLGRPLGLTWTFETDILEHVADTLRTSAALGVPARVEGLQLCATDTSWRRGEGAEVNGPLDALVLAMAGRPQALLDLTGDGAAVLATRVGAAELVQPG